MVYITPGHPGQNYLIKFYHVSGKKKSKDQLDLMKRPGFWLS